MSWLAICIWGFFWVTVSSAFLSCTFAAFTFATSSKEVWFCSQLCTLHFPVWRQKLSVHRSFCALFPFWFRLSEFSISWTFFRRCWGSSVKFDEDFYGPFPKIHFFHISVRVLQCFSQHKRYSLRAFFVGLVFNLEGVSFMNRETKLFSGTFVLP